MMSLVVFASGNGSNFEAIQQAIVDGTLKAVVRCVICDVKQAQVLKRAQQHGIDHYWIDPQGFPSKKDYETAIKTQIQQYAPDYIVCAGYMRIIGPVLLDAYPQRILNIHPSALPKYKGKDALSQAMAQGDTEIGITVHTVDETLDGGPIIDQRLFDIKDLNDQKTIEERLHAHEHQLYIEVLQRLSTEGEQQQ